VLDRCWNGPLGGHSQLPRLRVDHSHVRWPFSRLGPPLIMAKFPAHTNTTGQHRTGCSLAPANAKHAFTPHSNLHRCIARLLPRPRPRPTAYSTLVISPILRMPLLLLLLLLHAGEYGPSPAHSLPHLDRHRNLAEPHIVPAFGEQYISLSVPLLTIHPSLPSASFLKCCQPRSFHLFLKQTV
jgi:hypothetical protein